MYFVYFHTFSYKFKVQRTPTEFGSAVSKCNGFTVCFTCSNVLLNMDINQS